MSKATEHHSHTVNGQDNACDMLFQLNKITHILDFDSLFLQGLRNHRAR